MLKENIEIKGAIQVAKDTEKKVRTTGVRGLDIDKAKELGVFQRIANLLCVTHASIMAAYRIYGGVDYLIDQLNARKNEIAKEMNMFDKSFERFVRFWTDYYAHGKSGKEVLVETERLYRKIMEWMEIPENWQLGEEQRTKPEEYTGIQLTMPDKRILTLRKASINEDITIKNEKWGVLCYDPKANKQTSVYTDMDKASAMMVAKRLSKENKDCIYTASIIRDVEETKTEVVPYRTYMDNETIGKLIR